MTSLFITQKLYDPLFLPCLSLSLKVYLTKQSGILTIHSLGKCGQITPAIIHWQPQKWLAVNTHTALSLVLLMCLLIHLQFHAQF